MKKVRYQNSKTIITDLLKISGITVNGNQPYDIQVLDERLYARLFAEGTLGFGEAYMDGWFTSQQLDETIYRMVRSRDIIAKGLKMNLKMVIFFLKAYLFNLQNKKRSHIVAEQHYDLGNDLYEAMLDPFMQYTCAYWERGAKNLEEAQRDKMQLIGEKLALKPGMKILDIGCGWGGLANYLAKNFKVDVTGVTISKEQYIYAKERFASPQVNFKHMDYRDIEHKHYDRIIAIGLMEHIGHKNYAPCIKKIYNMLKEDGLSLIHFIGDTTTNFSADPWIDKYIFPNGMLPSVKQIGAAIVEPMVLEDWHNFGASYDKTLMAWHKNFVKAWPTLKKSGKYDERFYRMWEYYLLACAGSFRTRQTSQLWQIVLSKKGVPGGYKSVR